MSHTYTGTSIGSGGHLDILVEWWHYQKEQKVIVAKMARDNEIKTKRMLEHAVKLTNHAVRNIHTGQAQRTIDKLAKATSLLKQASDMLNGKA